MIYAADSLESIIEQIERAASSEIAIFLLRGELGVGKTTLVQAFTQKRGLRATSPTFSIMNVYGTIHHYDLYMHDTKKLLEIGFLDLLDSKNSIHFIEWANSDIQDLLTKYGYNFATITICRIKNANLYEMTVHG